MRATSHMVLACRMMTRCFTAVMLTALTACLCAADGAIVGHGPQFYVERETISLGRLSSGSISSFVVPVANQGDAPLVVRSIRTTCGCIHGAEKGRDVVIQPGRVEKFAFKIEATAGLPSINTKSIYFQTDDDEGVHEVFVSFSITSVLRLVVLPDKVEFGRSAPKANERVRRTLMVVSPYARPLYIKSIHTTGTNVICSEAEPGRYEFIRFINVEIPPGVPPGPFSGEITVNTSEGELVVPFFGRADRGVICDPGAAVFDPVRVGDTSQIQVRLISTDGSVCKIVRVVSGNKAVSVKEVTPGETRGLHVLTASFSPGEGTVGRAAGVIAVETDTSGIVEVPWYGIVAGEDASAIGEAAGGGPVPPIEDMIRLAPRVLVSERGVR